MWFTRVTILFGYICLSISVSIKNSHNYYKLAKSSIQEISIQSGETYNFRSRNYPLNYPTNKDVVYAFTSPINTTLKINCLEFRVPCVSDYMTISSSGNTNFSVDGVKYCSPSSDNSLPSVSTISNVLAVNFHSGGRDIFDSFFPNYRYQCNILASNVGSGSNGTTGGDEVNSINNGNCTCGIRNINGTSVRVVGGTETTRGEIPWRVLLNIRMSYFGPSGVCGGTIISPNWIMTAAHCTADFSLGHQITVTVGAQYLQNDGTKIIADRYVQYPGFDKTTMNGDMTLVHLPKPLKFNNYSISPACLPWNMKNSTFDNITALASGWGTTQPVPVGQTNTGSISKTLMKVELPVFGTQTCQQMFPNLTYISNDMICTYLPGKDTCQGDSGGSIDYQPIQNESYYSIGVVSFGDGCAQNDHPGIYSKVTKFLNWIQLTTGEDFCKP